MEKNNTPTWEIKDRTYVVKGKNQPPLVSIQSKHTQKKPLLWFDPEKGYNRELYKSSYHYITLKRIVDIRN